MKVKDIYNAIDSFAPFKYKEKWDNCGILIGSEENSVSKVILTLDVTEQAIDLAIKAGANLIVSHHPVIFDPLKSISGKDIVYKLIREDINVISAHTNLDVSPIGVNKCLADAIGLKNISPLLTTTIENTYIITIFVPVENTVEVRNALSQAGAGKIDLYADCSFSVSGIARFTPSKNAAPYIGIEEETSTIQEQRIEVICEKKCLNDVLKALKNSHPYETPVYFITENMGYTKDFSLGFVGELEKETTAKALAEHTKTALNCGIIRLTNPNKTVTKVAVCGGAGGSVIDAAISTGADAFITGDLKHNNMVESYQSKIALIDAGHFPTENIVLPCLTKTLSSICPTIEFIANINDDPCVYL